MQLLPTTAADPKVGIEDIHLVDPNIHAGVKYMIILRDRYFNDPGISEMNQHLLALGAYNAGPRRMINLRAEAEKTGYDPNIWFDNVEVIAAKRIGRETVQYVANIYKYYLAYRMTIEQQLNRMEAREKAGIHDE
jgi:membrane-bound lytic murein transglycosylase MltF